MCLPDYRTLSDLNDDELREVFRIYDVGELLSSEGEIDYVMARLPDMFPFRFKLIDYSFTDEDAEFFKRKREEAIAEGIDVDEEF